jgi:hypothetical protein
MINDHDTPNGPKNWGPDNSYLAESGGNLEQSRPRVTAGPGRRDWHGQRAETTADAGAS